MRRLLMAIWLLWGISDSIRAQVIEESQFHRYTTSDGISDNSITGIVQDSSGYIWIATRHGLNRYDGHSFKQFLHTPAPGSIPDNAIFSLSLLSNNELAIATDDGAQILSASTLHVKNLLIPTDDELRYWSNACRYVAKDRQGNYGVSTKTGFFIFSSSGKLKKRLDYYTSHDIGHSWMMFGSRIHVMPDGNMMQENSKGLIVFEPSENRISNALSRYPRLYSTLQNMEQTRERIMFVSTDKMLIFNIPTNSFDYVNTKNGEVHSVKACINLQEEIGWQTTPVRINDTTIAFNSKKSGLFILTVDPQRMLVKCAARRYFADYKCITIFSDRNERLWIGTTEGLLMENLHLPIIRSFNIETGKKNFYIRAIFPTADKIYAAAGNKIFVVDKPKQRLVHEFTLPGLPENGNISSILEVSKDTVWVTAATGLYWFHKINFNSGKVWSHNIFNDSLRAIQLFNDRSGRIWITAENINAVYFYDPHARRFDSLTQEKYPLLAVNIPNSFAEDRAGNIWIGGDAICRWNPRSRNIDTLIKRLPGQRNRKKGFTVLSDSRKDIWVLVNDDGLSRITGDTIHLRPENLHRDYSIIAYPNILDDRIFMPVYNGLGYMNIRDLKSVIFTKPDGMPDIPITTNNFARDPVDKSVWFACWNRICRFPYYQSPNYLIAPRLRFTELSVLQDTTYNYPVSSISLDHDRNDLKLSVSAINFTDPENMRFAYRFKNHSDSFWIELGVQQDILLTNLSPGKYNMQVKVYAYDNKWPAQLGELEINIRPPFWKTSWFLALAALTLATLVFYLYRRRIKQIGQRASLDKRLAETEMKALHAQMNPHFIFNCLNSIREMILENENRQASHYLSKFAHLIRITLHQSSRPFISLQDTLDYLRRYLEMEQIRTSHFTYHIDVDESLDPAGIMLPPMLIQPFIENAIWHGSANRKDPLDLKIFFIQKNDRLICLVEDNGIGIEASLKNKNELDLDHQPVGIANIRQRMQVLNEKYNMQNELTIEDRKHLSGHSGSGTLVTLSFPLKYV